MNFLTFLFNQFKLSKNDFSLSGIGKYFIYFETFKLIQK